MSSYNNERHNILYKYCKTHNIPIKNKYFHLAMLNVALTHRSYSNKKVAHYSNKNFIRRTWRALVLTIIPSMYKMSLKMCDKNNERLEFLGDAVLNVIITEYLMMHFLEKSEGQLSRIKSYIISRHALYYVACILHLHEVFMSKGTFSKYLSPKCKSEFFFGNEKQKVSAPLANAVEALIGAIYITRGISVTKKFVLKHFSPIVEIVLRGEHIRDYKSMLQHYVQSKYKAKPVYAITRVAGPDHAKCYSVTVYINDEYNNNKKHSFGASEGSSKKEAEQKAAKIACNALSIQESDILF